MSPGVAPRILAPSIHPSIHPSPPPSPGVIFLKSPQRRRHQRQFFLWSQQSCSGKFWFGPSHVSFPQGGGASFGDRSIRALGGPSRVLGGGGSLHRGGVGGGHPSFCLARIIFVTLFGLAPSPWVCRLLGIQSPPGDGACAQYGPRSNLDTVCMAGGAGGTGGR